VQCLEHKPTADVWHLGDMLRVPGSCEDSIAARATNPRGAYNGAAVRLDGRTEKYRVSHTGTSDIKADTPLIIEVLIAHSCCFQLCSYLRLLLLLSLPPLFCSCVVIDDPSNTFFYSSTRITWWNKGFIGRFYRYEYTISTRSLKPSCQCDQRTQ